MAVVHVLPTWESHVEGLECWCAPAYCFVPRGDIPGSEEKRYMSYVEAAAIMAVNGPLVVVHRASTGGNDATGDAVVS